MPTYASSSPGLQLLDTHYQQQVAQGLIPDLFSRYVPTQTNNPPAGGGGALGGSFGPPAPTPPGTTPPPAGGSTPTPPGGTGGQGNGPQLAQASLLYQMLQQGSQGFLGRLTGGPRPSGGRPPLGGDPTFGGNIQTDQLAQAGQGFSGLTDPRIQALFSPQNYYQQSLAGGAARPGMGLVHATSQSGPNPQVFQNAITALRLLLGL